MPDVVKGYIQSGTFSNSLTLQRQIQLDYEEDVRKYADGLEQTKIISVYTVDEYEAAYLVTLGWRFDNISFYVYARDAKEGKSTYRAYNPSDGQHNFTVNKSEHDYIVGLSWIDEKIACNSV